MAKRGLLVGSTTGWTSLPTCSAMVTILVSRSRSLSSTLVSWAVTPKVRAGRTLQVTTTTSRWSVSTSCKDALEHRQTARAAGGDQDGFGMFEAEGFDGDAVAGALVELLEMLVLSAMAAMGDVLDDDEDDQEGDGEADAPDGGGFLGEEVDQGGAGEDQEDGEDADGEIDFAVPWCVCGC